MVDLLVIQPTPFCNINCSYCYLTDRSNPNKISLATVERIIYSLISDDNLGSHLSLVWHAGEPLALSPSFYKPFFQLFSKMLDPRKISVQHSIQTNATLITEEWCEFIQEYDIRIGVSVDGPKHIHDAKRVTRSGKGTFDKVIVGLELLKKNNINFHGIAVVGDQTLDYPEEFFNFFYYNGFYHLGLNIEEVEGGHAESDVFKESLSEKVKFFYSRLFDLYMKSDKHMRIREFDNSLNAILRQPETIDIRNVNTNSHQNRPMAIISVDYLGNFSTFSPELIGQSAKEYNNFIFGNIRETTFKNPTRGDLLKIISKEINAGIKKCKKECDYFWLCGGGAPANKYFENSTFNSSATNYCKYNIKVPTDLVIAFLEKELNIV